MHLHFGTQSLNVRFSIEKPGKGERAYCTGETSHLFKKKDFNGLMVRVTEINGTDSRIQTSCPKFYPEFFG